MAFQLIRRGPSAAIAAGSVLAVTATLGLAPAGNADPPVTQSFTTPGTYSFTVPAGVTSLQVTAVGGEGGPVPYGGFGASLTATLAVSPGEVLDVQVAGNGASGRSDTGGGSGGFGGGGAGGCSPDNSCVGVGGGGGGASTVSRPDGTLLVVAGGGGGTGAIGAAGGAAGQPGASAGTCGGGGAGTASGGGAGGGGAGGDDGSPGTSGQGGAGGQGGGDDPDGGGGGGGGLFGGGGGGGGNSLEGCVGAGGGGGSSYVDPALTQSSIGADTTGKPEVVFSYYTPTITVQVSGSQTFGGTPTFTETDDAPSGASLGGTLTCTSVDGGTAVGPSLAAGGHTVDGSSCSGLSASGFAVSYVGVADGFVVTPATITVNVSGSQTFGGTPTFTETDDAPSGVSLTGTLACSTVDGGTAIGASLAAGSHTIDGSSCSGLGPSSSDYALAYVGVADGFTVLAPDLALSLSAPATAVSGNPFTYRIVVTNGGDLDASDVTVTDVLPSSVHFESVSTTEGDCTRSTGSKPKTKGGTLTCRLGSLAAGAAATITAVVTATRPLTLDDAASVTASNVGPADADDADSATTTVLGT